MSHGNGEKIGNDSMNNTEKIYSFYLALFITMIVLTNIIGVKLFEILCSKKSVFIVI